MRGGVWKNKYRMNLFAFYGHGSVAGGKDDIPLLASVYHPCVDTNSDNEDEVTNTTMCGTQTPTSAELPGLFRADNDESRVFLSMLAGDGRQAFRGIFALPAAEDATNAVYLYSAVPVMHARENRTVGYVVGGADVRLYVRDWSKGLEACVSVWGDETATVPADVAAEAARGMVRLDVSEATQANTEGNFTQATTRLRRLFASDRRVCSSSARLEFHRRGTQACTATYTFLPNAMPTTPDDRVDAATKAVHDELARRLREHGAYLRVDVPRSARQTAVDISRTYLAMTTVVMVTMCVVLFVFVEVGVLRPLYAIVHTLKQRVNAFVEELTDGNALGRRRRKLLVHEMLADVAVARGRGDEVAIVRALAEHLNAIHGAELQHALAHLREKRDENRTLLEVYRLVNMLAGREDAELAQRLPGLARDRLKRTTLRQMAASGALVVKHPAEFKTLKHILAHPTATQFFKSYCRRCGPEAFQSLMFLIDVLWLRHIEAGSRSRLEDLASIAAHEGGGNGGNGGADDDDDDGNGNSLFNVLDGGKDDDDDDDDDDESESDSTGSLSDSEAQPVRVESAKMKSRSGYLLRPQRADTGTGSPLLGSSSGALAPPLAPLSPRTNKAGHRSFFNDKDGVLASAPAADAHEGGSPRQSDHSTDSCVSANATPVLPRMAVSQSLNDMAPTPGSPLKVMLRPEDRRTRKGAAAAAGANTPLQSSSLAIDATATKTTTTTTTAHATPRNKLMPPRTRGTGAQEKVIARFETELGKHVARTMYKAYFGERSLAQRNRHKAALIGCSKCREYFLLRDSDHVVLSLKTFEALAHAVTKRMGTETVARFQQSLLYRAMLLLVDIEDEIGKHRLDPAAAAAAASFGSGAHPSTSAPANLSTTPASVGPSFSKTPIFRHVWFEMVDPDASPLSDDEDDE